MNGGNRMPDDIETREEVAEEASPETPVEQTEQREDDYEGIKRILEAKFDELAAMLERVAERIDGVMDAQAEEAVRSGVVITDGTAEPEPETSVESDDVVLQILDGDVTLEDLMTRGDDE